MKSKELQNYWSNRYDTQQTGWDIGAPSRPLKSYIDQCSNKELRVLIPGAGNAYEAEYLFRQGFSSVTVLDISEKPLDAFKERVPSFPEGHLIQGDFFAHLGAYDLILEQTFFCSFQPTRENRERYASKMSQLLKPGGKLVGVWFNNPLFEGAKRPFGGSREEYLGYLTPYFEVDVFEACRNSIPERQGKELFGIFSNKKQ